MSDAARYDPTLRGLPPKQQAACEAIRRIKSRVPEIRPVLEREVVVFITFEDGSGAYVDTEGRVTES
jgi:hypothetical protein